MPISEKNREDGVRTFVLPPLLTQHMLPVEGSRRPAARMEGSCNNSTPRPPNNCFYRRRGSLLPEYGELISLSLGREPHFRRSLLQHIYPACSQYFGHPRL